MKKLYLLGDSIRMGYESAIKRKLTGRAVAFSPAVNGEFAQYTLRHLNEWADKSGYAGEIDLVHWNNGLWDALRVLGDECLTPPEVYALTLRRIYKRIKIVFPKAAVIFALSTPIIEERYKEPDRFFRFNKDIRAYNAIAADVMKELNVKVNDLYTVADSFAPALYDGPTHFVEEANNILADAVVRACEPYLKN
jgi:hypothetical protein